MPPITQLNEIFEFPEKLSRSSNICNASSRVGARINDLGDLGEEGGNFLLVIFWSNGRPKAAVFPVPVCAVATISLPEKIFGIAMDWIFVGDSKPKLLRLEQKLSCNPRFAN